MNKFEEQSDFSEIKDRLIQVLLKGEKAFKDFLKELKTHYQEMYEEIKENGGFGELLKTFSDIAELKMETLTFSDMVDNARSKKPKECRRCCLIVLNKEMVLPEFADYSKHYFMCFLNEQNEMASDNLIYFHCNTLDEKLEKLFGDKEMIILQ